MRIYRRRLPHWDVPDRPVFVTWRLKGSLPRERCFYRESLRSGESFLALDRLLDTSRSGPSYLPQPDVAELVTEQLREAASEGLSTLHAYVVMPNHVHALWTPRIALAELVRHVKGAAARLANKLLSRAGQPFWQEEYFDHLVRNEQEFDRIRRYIEWNPVRASLVTDPRDFTWSSAHEVRE
ncbi:MAG: transposase [Acidobacteriales bacterium]|nr:transposase [Terriglobales bacterium]